MAQRSQSSCAVGAGRCGLGAVSCASFAPAPAPWLVAVALRASSRRGTGPIGGAGVLAV